MDSINGQLRISNNQALSSLSGIDSISSASIGNLRIFGNTSLEICDIQSICNYLVSPNGTVEIYGNAQGCNSQAEVEEACTVGFPEHQLSHPVTTHPNPFTTTTTIEYELTEPTHIQLTFYNHLGEAVEEAVSAYKLPGVHTYEWGAERLSEGMYFAVLRNGDGVLVVKLIKQ